eukprot:CAMPEP_0184741858 /NCGR_PEP_ID=MMETSP0315-20130426/4864_1 /TAXON_ID=101924 /ORGANISM="Rhodosorus marinus, Strain UTEX LB 2760" /LENGTH=589 /DNA_ID=CAMNT_0027212389 /DNA_START=549 /DNA_END=2318 /DNA_ORIENTATION=-
MATPTLGRADLFKQLNANGLAPELCESYLYVLKQFLTAKTTKIEFEASLRKVLPANKISVHNDLVRHILRSACAKKDGLPDLPNLGAVKKEKTTPKPKTPVQNKRVVGANQKKIEDHLADVSLQSDGFGEGAAADGKKQAVQGRKKGEKAQRTASTKAASTAANVQAEGLQNSEGLPAGKQGNQKLTPQQRTNRNAQFARNKQGPGGIQKQGMQPPQVGTNQGPVGPQAPIRMGQQQGPTGRGRGQPGLDQFGQRHAGMFDGQQMPQAQMPTKAQTKQQQQQQQPFEKRKHLQMLRGKGGGHRQQDEFMQGQRQPGQRQPADQMAQGKPNELQGGVPGWGMAGPNQGLDVKTAQGRGQATIKRKRAEVAEMYKNKKARPDVVINGEAYRLQQKETEKLRDELMVRSEALDSPSQPMRPPSVGTSSETSRGALSRAQPAPVSIPSAQRPAPSPTAARAGAMSLARGGSQAPSYNSLSFSPVPPGLKMDMELFLKMKVKLRKWVEYMGLSDVSDGATEVMAMALEMHMKNILEASSGRHISKSGNYGFGRARAGGRVVQSIDLRNALMKNPARLLGEDNAVDMERLTLALY